jgi:hypothetical protein
MPDSLTVVLEGREATSAALAPSRSAEEEWTMAEEKVGTGERAEDETLGERPAQAPS